jgi:hypothetical protein
MVEELYVVYATCGLILLFFLVQAVRRRFDPFAPVWLFLVGYGQVYVVQAISYHDWAIGTRGKDLVAAANFRAFWAIAWFLLVYMLGIGRRTAAVLPSPPRRWSPLAVGIMSPPLVLWGLYCSGLFMSGGFQTTEGLSGEELLFLSFPFVMIVAAVMLIVTGRTAQMRHPYFLMAGLLAGTVYVFIWMYNGKRSHSLIGILATVCAFYLTRVKRPSWPVLISTAVSGALVVAVALGWRETREYERSFAGFAHYVGDFKLEKVLVSLNMKDDEQTEDMKTYETTEYGGFLLMMDTVPAKSEYDYGESYLRVFSTFIPRIVWPSKPLYGRRQWVNAWIAGSDMERAEDFSGPAIGILGATQLNGGWIGTLIVLACLALVLRTGYEYLQLYPDVPWVQFWWAITYYNAWFMVVNDDPMIWFYYNWGFTTMPIVAVLWIVSKWSGSGAERELSGRALVPHFTGRQPA